MTAKNQQDEKPQQNALDEYRSRVAEENYRQFKDNLVGTIVALAATVVFGAILFVSPIAGLGLLTSLFVVNAIADS